MGLRYRDVEAALAKALGVAEGDRPAFRARIRHLRNIGVPDLPKVGSGTQVTYTQENLIHLATVLEMQALGFPPQTAADLLCGHLNTVMMSSSVHQTYLTIGSRTLDGREKKDVAVGGYNKVMEFLRLPGARRIAVIDLSATFAALAAALP